MAFLVGRDDLSSVLGDQKKCVEILAVYSANTRSSSKQAVGKY